MKLLSSLLAATALAVSFPAAAEPLQGAKLDAANRATGQDAGAQSGILPTAFALTAGADSSEATVSASRTWDDDSDRLGFTSLSLRLSTPIDKGKTDGMFLTGGGSVSGSKAEVTFARYVLPGNYAPLDSKRTLEILDGARAACRAQVIKALQEATCDKAYYSTVEGYLDAEARKKNRKLLADEAFYNAPLWNYGVTASIGYDKHDYRDALSLHEGSAARTSLSGSVFVGAVIPINDRTGASVRDLPAESRTRDAEATARPVVAGGV